ncbi:MAG: ribosome silencing factor [Alphaproteobacteria bacterium]|nr:ribosome silencing factor [Alphaproteobacteria bacterium]
MSPLKKPLTPQALKELIVHYLDSKKAQNIITVDLAGKSTVADFLVIVSGTSARQVGSMAELLRVELKKHSVENIHIEGLPQCDWVLVDAGDVIVHVFRPEIRAFYNLEKMWGLDSFEEISKVTSS